MAAIIPKKKKLGKELGLADVFAICTGTMISSGFFLLPGIAAANCGPAVVLAYVLSAILVIPSLLSTAELATGMPRAGGTYFFISRSLGAMFGTVEGVGDWLALLLKSSIALIGLGAYLAVYVDLPVPVLAAVCCLVFGLVNYVGSKGTSGLQLAMVLILVALLAVFVGTGITRTEPEHFHPFAPFGMGAILPTAGLVFVSFIGITKVASIAEEIKSPGRNIPLGMLLSLLIVGIIYGVGVWIVVGVVPPELLYDSYTPVVETARIISGRTGVIVISVAAVLAFATTANAGLMSASRYLLAMGRDRTIPHLFSRLSRYRTPKYGLLLTVILVLLIITTINPERIAKLASTFQLLVFALLHVAVIVMRESGIQSYDPAFKSPFYPYMQIAGIGISVVLIPEMGILASVFAIGLVALGVIWYNFYVRKHFTRVGAVAQMAERVAERLLSRDAAAMGLERELREILKEKGLRRDDPFAQLVMNAGFVELRSDEGSEDVLRRGADELARESDVSADLIYGALMQRNQLGETPAEAGVALPHLLLQGVRDSYMVMARSVRGIEFPMADQPIYAVFILLGDRQSPNVHLRMLAEIACRAESREFLRRWRHASSEVELKEILLEQQASDV